MSLLSLCIKACGLCFFYGVYGNAIRNPKPNPIPQTGTGTMGAIVATVYQRNLLYQQTSFKWKSYLYLKNIVKNLHSVGWSRKFLFITVFCLIHLIDFALGVLTLLLVQKYSIREWMRAAVSSYTLTMLHWSGELIRWLMGIPGGLKLNTPLDDFLGTRFLTILQFWEYFYSDFIATYLTSILSFILLLSPLGITIFLMALHDFLKFLNLCLICFFVFSLRIFRLQVSALKSLARLFMGKKWNILRKRVDSCNYDTSQLLMGTILFTILLFLLPTTGMYFLIFLMLRLLQFTVQFLLRTGVVLVNKATVLSWIAIYSFLEDTPVTKAKVLITPLHSQQSLENGEQLANIRVFWNGKIHTVDELKKALLSHPEGVLDRVCASMESSPGKFQHSMLNWIGQLPL